MYSIMHLGRWLTGYVGGSVDSGGGVCTHEMCRQWGRGGVDNRVGGGQRGVHPPPPGTQPEMATTGAGDTHPTGMHTCYIDL